LGIAAGVRFDQRTQIIQQARIGLDQRLATTARPSNAARVERLSTAQLHQPATDSATRHTRGTRHCTDPAAPSRHCLGRRKTSPGPLVEHWRKRLEPNPDG